MPTIRELDDIIDEQADLLTWITTGIFCLSIFSSIVRSDPTLAVCLFGFYGAHVRSKGAIRSFWVFLSLTWVVDWVWLVDSSRVSPVAGLTLWEQLGQLERQEQLAVALTMLNMFYKLVVVGVSIKLQFAFARREAELVATPRNPASGAGCTSSGEPAAKGSLAAQDSASGR